MDPTYIVTWIDLCFLGAIVFLGLAGALWGMSRRSEDLQRRLSYVESRLDLLLRYSTPEALQADLADLVAEYRNLIEGSAILQEDLIANSRRDRLSREIMAMIDYASSRKWSVYAGNEITGSLAGHPTARQ